MASVLVVTVRQHFHAVLVALAVGELGRDQPSVSRGDLGWQVVGVRIATNRKVHRIILTVGVLVVPISTVWLNDFARVLRGKRLYAAPALEIAIVAALEVACRPIDHLGARLPHQLQCLVLKGRCLPAVSFLFHCSASIHI